MTRRATPLDVYELRQRITIPKGVRDALDVEERDDLDRFAEWSQGEVARDLVIGPV